LPGALRGRGDSIDQFRPSHQVEFGEIVFRPTIAFHDVLVVEVQISKTHHRIHRVLQGFRHTQVYLSAKRKLALAGLFFAVVT